MVIAHYLLGFLANQEKLISRAAEVLAEGGMFSVNYYGLTKEHLYWRRVFEKMGLEISFAENAYAKAKKNHDDFEKLLHRYFKKVDYVTLPSSMCYETVDELFARALKRYPEAANALRANKDRFAEYYSKILAEEEKVIINSEGGFWHCWGNHIS